MQIVVKELIILFIKNTFNLIFSSFFQCVSQLVCFHLQAGVARIGPWGGDGGMSCDIDATPHHLESVIIWSCLVIDSITFSFRDHNDQQHHAGPWGGCGGNDHKVSLKHNEIKLLFKKK